MKNNITKTIIIVLFIFGLSACSDSYFDVNTPSGTVTYEDLRMNDLLAPVIHSTLEGQRSAELAFGNYVQYFVSEGGGAAGEAEVAALWNQIYLYILPNIKVIKEKAEAKGAKHFGAIADILTAINLGIATDTWGNIPYSEATQAEQNFTPAFDTQQEIYNEIFTLLNSAIIALEGDDNSGISIGKEDLIYKGNIEKWTKAAYTLKARYQLHLVNKGIVSATDVLATITNGFESDSDDFQMNYDDINFNPWYVSEVRARETGNFHRDIASQLISTMNGDYYPFVGGLTIDPRLPIFADVDFDFENNVELDASNWKGYVSGGGGLAPDGSDANTHFVEEGYYTKQKSPLVLITYAEALFIKAEAAFLAAGGNTTSVGSNAMAYNAYMDGINASMSKYEVDGTVYMSDAIVSVGEAGLMLNHIMKEKYIHNFLNPETFVDFRRYDFSPDVFKGLTIREEVDSDGDYAGEWFRRASYPTAEVNGNSVNVELNRKSPIEGVWWDQ